jgi:hypothetical protein
LGDPFTLLTPGITSGTTQVKCLKKKVPNYFIGKIRDHVQYERAIWPLDLDYFVGTQFHPEADPVSFVSILEIRRKKKKKHERREKIQNYA